MASSGSYAQKLAKQITIQAQAMGTSTQLGRNFSLNLIIQELSTDADRQGLIEAFTQKGNEGLVNALDKMRSKGRMSITGTLGYEITYIKMWKQPDGTTRLRLVTDRPITFGEAWADSRSKDYSLSAVELILSPNKKQNKGTLYPACQLKMNKEGELELQLYQNAWNLVNIMKR
jgi:hypothetical protein